MNAKKVEVIAKSDPDWQRLQKVRKAISKLAEVPEECYRFVGNDQIKPDLTELDLKAVNKVQLQIGLVAADNIASATVKLRRDPVLDVIQNPNEHNITRRGFGLLDKAEFLEINIQSIFGQYWFPAERLGRQFTVECLRALVDDYIAQACCWHEDFDPSCRYLLVSTPRFNEKLASVLPNRGLLTEHGIVNITPLFDRFEVEVLNVVREYIHSLVHKNISGPTWNICFSSPAPMGVTINVGPDFRVLDWESRMESGVWRM